MRRTTVIYFILIFSFQIALGQRVLTPVDTLRKLPRKPWIAASEVVGVNMLIWGFNYFVSDAPFAQINIHTMKTNLSTLPVWDTDKFSTNLVAHPYHGSLYFNAARSNGMNFWESIPFTFGGSLMWEYFMENELPSVNDLFATTFGGVELGEITFRLSDLVLDNRLTGFPRVVREVSGGILSPIRAFNRIITGEAWKYQPTKGNVFNHRPVGFSFHIGPRFLAEQERSRHGELSTSVGLMFSYGDPYEQDYFVPYEYFRINAVFDFFSHQPVCTQVNALGVLWGKNVWNSGNRSLTTGIFQHFDYYDSQIRTKEGKLIAPYRISEAAAVGGGIIYQNKALSHNHFGVRTELYVNGIALGASLTDYFFVDERDYNLGSGYSIKSYTGLNFRDRWNLILSAENYHIFTWKGYDPDLDLSTVDFTRLNVQGDKGNARLGVFTIGLSYHSPQKWNISLSNSYYSRYTKYKYHDNVDYGTSDFTLSWGFSL